MKFEQIYHQQLGDIVNLKCHIISNPNENVKFVWHLNGSNIIIDNHSGLGLDDGDDSERRKTTKFMPSKSKNSIDLIVHSDTVHKNINQNHLITNIIQIQLKHWSSFGTFSCRAQNQIGQQNDPCRWRLIPKHFQNLFRDQFDLIQQKQQQNQEKIKTKSSENNRRLDYDSKMKLISPNEMFDNDDHSERSSSSSSKPNQLTDCQIIESSIAVVVKCSNGVEIFERDLDPSVSSRPEIVDANDLQLTYHVQVFSLNQSSSTTSASGTKRSKKRKENNRDHHHHHYSHRESIQLKNNQPETRKQIATIQTSTIGSILSNELLYMNFRNDSNKTNIFDDYEIVDEDNNDDGDDDDLVLKNDDPENQQPSQPQLIMDTLNFTNPLFIITNLSASTSYLLRIWSSKSHMDDLMIEQVNITVRTKPIEDDNDRGVSVGFDGVSLHKTNLDRKMSRSKVFPFSVFDLDRIFLDGADHQDGLLIIVIIASVIVSAILILSFVIVKIKHWWTLRKNSGKLFGST